MGTKTIKVGHHKLFKVKCNYCKSKVGYTLDDIVTRPDERFPLALMNKYIQCPRCTKLIYMGCYKKHSWEEGNYKEKLKERD